MIVHIPDILLLVMFGLAVKTRNMTRWAAAGLIAYAASYGLANTFTLFAGQPRETLITIWQASLWATLFMYCFIAWAKIKSLKPFILFVPFIIALSVGDGEFNRRFEDTVMLAGIAVATWWMLFSIEEKDVFGRLIWFVVAMAETFALLEYGGCNFLPLTESGISVYSCGRKVVEWWPMVLPTLTTIPLAFLVVRHRLWVRDRTGRGR